MVVVGVVVLLHGVKLDGDDLVGGAAVGGGVGEAEKTAITVGRNRKRWRNEEGDAFTWGCVVDAVHVDEEGGVEGDEFSIEFAVIVVPELEGFVVEDPAGVVGEDDVADAVGGDLEGSEVDVGGGYDVEDGVVGVVEGAPGVRFGLEDGGGFGGRRREEEQEEDDGGGGEEGCWWWRWSHVRVVTAVAAAAARGGGGALE